MASGAEGIAKLMTLTLLVPAAHQRPREGSQGFALLQMVARLAP
jgi:hypothetical protein